MNKKNVQLHTHILVNGTAFCRVSADFYAKHWRSMVNDSLNPVCGSADTNEIDTMVNFIRQFEPDWDIEVVVGFCPEAFKEIT